MHLAHCSPGEPLAGQSQPLAVMLRDVVGGDVELRELVAKLKAHLYRGIAWWDDERRRHAASRLSRLAPGLPKMIQPATLTRAAVEAQYGADPRTAHLQDPWAAIWSHRVRGRMAAVLVGFFDELRIGAFVAIGRLYIDPISPILIPVELWDATATAVDTVTGDVLIGRVRTFIDVTIEPPAAQPRSASRSALDRFIPAFDARMMAGGRRYVVNELVAAARQQLGGATSAREVEGALRRSSPAAWAGSGRRAAHVVPTEAELAQAARQAAETRV